MTCFSILLESCALSTSVRVLPSSLEASIGEIPVEVYKDPMIMVKLLQSSYIRVAGVNLQVAAVHIN